jgi:hypothetical protein
MSLPEGVGDLNHEMNRIYAEADPQHFNQHFPFPFPFLFIRPRKPRLVKPRVWATKDCAPQKRAGCARWRAATDDDEHYVNAIAQRIPIARGPISTTKTFLVTVARSGFRQNNSVVGPDRVLISARPLVRPCSACRVDNPVCAANSHLSAMQAAVGSRRLGFRLRGPYGSHRRVRSARGEAPMADLG